MEATLQAVISVIKDLTAEKRIDVLSRLLAIQCVHSGHGWADYQRIISSAMHEVMRVWVAALPDRQIRAGQGAQANPATRPRT